MLVLARLRAILVDWRNPSASIDQFNMQQHDNDYPAILDIRHAFHHPVNQSTAQLYQPVHTGLLLSSLPSPLSVLLP